MFKRVAPIKPLHPQIPGELWSIRFGSHLPETKMQPHQTNAKGWVDLNKDKKNFKVNLLSDSISMDEKDFKELKAFCEKTNINFVDLEDKPDFPNRNAIRYENQCKNWERASDIARVSLLLQGGVYVDGDLAPKAPLPTCYAPYGIRLCITGAGDRKEIQIHFMASIPNHPLFRNCVEHFRNMYDMLFQLNDHQKLSMTKNSDISHCMLVLTTANAIPRLYKAVSDNVNEELIKFELEKYVDIRHDRSYEKNKGTRRDPDAEELYDEFERQYIEYQDKGKYIQLVKNLKAEWFAPDSVFKPADKKSDNSPLPPF